MCGIADNSDTCGVTVQKDLFTPRLGIAYRPFDSFVIRAGYSRNPQNDHMYRSATYTYPASITITQSGLNSFQPAGTLETGYRVSPDSRLQHRFAGIAARRTGSPRPPPISFGERSLRST